MRNVLGDSKKIYVAIISLCIALVISGCSNSASASSSKELEEVSSEVPISEAPSRQSVPASTLTPSSSMGDESIDEPWETKGKFIPKKASTTAIETYKICEGTVVENGITLLTATDDGPTIFLIAGQHGDEIAGWMAINNLKDMELKKGKVYILSPANLAGANADPRVRYTYDQNDLNRSFPGNPNGNPAEILADGIMKEILKAQPSIILDHHEAREVQSDRDFLGSSLIYSTLNGIDDLFLDMHQATQDRELCAEPFKFYGPGPVGSMNNYLAATYDMPVITVETYRAYRLERRIEEHMAIAGYVLSYYDMI